MKDHKAKWLYGFFISYRIGHSVQQKQEATKDHFSS
jgi:hypothetical protein